jgi:beta-galactosidase
VTAARPWESPELTGWRRLPAHAVPRVPGGAGAEVRRLDGEWRFQLLPSPETPLADRWALTEVPGCWTVQGFEDIHGVNDLPQYTNVRMPWPDAPPHPPAANPTGVYERTVTVPTRWSGRRIVLHVGAAESVVSVRIGDSEVGIGKDSHLANEFDVTDAVRPGEPTTIRLTVVKWSDASFAEDQDQWWHGGITRSVYLYATDAQLYLEDVHVAEATADGVLRVDVRVQAAAGRTLPEGWRVTGHLEGVGELGPDTAYAEANEADERVSDWLGLARISARLPGVRPWSAETPTLYGLTVRLHRADGTVADEARCRIGFRTVEIVGRDLLVNGRRVLIRGVNRHDFDPLTGRVVSAHEMRADLTTAKRFGFNAIRTSHYPNDPELLNLADELGLFVVDEADIETHDHAHELADDPRYLAAFVDRVSRMVLRDKNHPSVIMWSLGNESDYGANHDAAAGWVRHYDPTRPLHYEGAIKLGWADAGMPVSDVVCPMYSSIGDIVAHAESGTQTRPLIMCEYSHAMGNSNGTLAEYWAAIESTPGLQGGFIWEFRDHGILQRLADGRPAGPRAPVRASDGIAPAGHRWAYGGDFGDVPNDGVFCADGLFLPDRTPKPAAYEHREIAAPVRLEYPGGGQVEIRNRQDFLGLDHLEGTWILSGTDGEPRTEPADLLAPYRPEPAEGETWLTLRVTASGEDVCMPSVCLRPEDRDLLTRAGAEIESGGVIELDDAGLLLHPLLASAPVLSLWRAPTDNDVLGGMADRWRKWGLEAPVRTLLAVTHDGARTGVRSEYATAVGPVAHEQSFTALSGGGVLVEETATLPDALDDVARVGSVFETAARYADAEWFGTGPWETYPDRATAPVSRHRSTVDALYTPYLRPQESGGRNGVRWMTLSIDDAPDLTIHLDVPRQVNVSRYRAAGLAAAHHDELVPLPDRCVVYIDAAHRGLGTASCGPDTLPAYRIAPGVHRWSWTIR